MSSRSWQLRISDMLQAAGAARGFAKDKSPASLAQDEQLLSAIMFQLIIIGEAA